MVLQHIAVCPPPCSVDCIVDEVCDETYIPDARLGSPQAPCFVQADEALLQDQCLYPLERLMSIAACTHLDGAQ
jgi:hypothetical protein